MGISNAKYFCFSRQDLSGEEALRQGLANRSFPTEELRAAALDFAADVASGPTLAFAMNKAMIDESIRRSLDENLAAADEALRASMASEDLAEAQRAMEEGRAPVFKSR